MKRRNAFTMVELLVVIAIIAILAAIIFPVFARAKDTAKRGGDLSNMNSLRNALQLYRVDQGAYPPAILGYASYYMSGPNTGQIIPAPSLKTYLYPRRLDSINTLKPAYNEVPNNEITTAVWPNADQSTGAILDLNGDGQIDNNDDPTCARQYYDRAQTVQRRDPNNNNNLVDAEYYRISGYDVADVPRAVSGKWTELRYALHWTGWGLGAGSCTLGNGMDDPRQLGYFDPPETTVVTWNSYFRDWNRTTGIPDRSQKDLVLFLGGAAKPYDSRAVFEKSWRVLPR